MSYIHHDRNNEQARRGRGLYLLQISGVTGGDNLPDDMNADFPTRNATQ